MNNIKKFVEQWKNRGYEKGETHSFWLSFLRDVLNVSEPEKFVNFEVPVKLQHTKFIDAYFPDSKVIVEQKSIDKNLLPAYEQAQKYVTGLPLSMHPKKIVVCNFKLFLIYDMETLEPPIKIFLEDLPQNPHVFDFLIDENKNKLRIELELSLKAGEIVGKLYDALHAQYINPNSPDSLASLNKLCVRLVFCLYAESSGIFGKHKIFRDWLEGSRNIRQDLILLFDVLNTPIDARDPYLDDTLKKFPYVNGGLFAQAIEIPNFTPEIKFLLLEEASSSFNWSGISPTIFGAVFESTLNPQTRRAAGMHYTSVENIHKVIDPLFLDDLNAQLTNSTHMENVNRSSKRKNFLLNLQKKLSEIKIFDPACGSGNFLTESFISLRRIENNILKLLLGSQITLGDLSNPIKVSISQFYGVEINDFAVSVAQTALWIAELQMIHETQQIIHRDLDFLPLKSYSNIVEANSLHINWQNVFKVDRLVGWEVDRNSTHLPTSSLPTYIIGNPPFVGASMMNPAQKADAVNIFGKIKLSNSIDYVGAWYYLAAKLIQGTNIKAAFVSTNSITQGEQVSPLWKKILGDFGMKIIFCHRTFKWNSESPNKAAVHCVIIGFGDKNLIFDKKIFDGDKIFPASNINPYLLDAPNVFIESRAKHFQNSFVPRIFLGNKPSDGGNLILTAEERENILKREPALEKFIYRYVGGNEFINNVERYCFWLINATPGEIRKSKELYMRLEGVKKMREASTAKPTREKAATPHLFFFISQPTTDYILIPMTSSENRRYLPIGFMKPEIIASNAALIVPGAQIYEFGVLTSAIHMAWVRAVAGRLEMRYRYSGSVVYNNFPWVEVEMEAKRSIEASAAEILAVRERYLGSTLADLYDELTMPADLRAAHRKNDILVARAYGFEEIMDDEQKIVAELMKMYERLTKS